MIQKLIDAYELEREMYRKCINTDEEIEKGRAKWDSGLWIRYKVFEDAITLAPRVEAEPVIRCKDCYFCGEIDENGWHCCENLGVGMPKNGFCSDAERREDVKVN